MGAGEGVGPGARAVEVTTIDGIEFISYAVGAGPAQPHAPAPAPRGAVPRKRELAGRKRGHEDEGAAAGPAGKRRPHECEVCGKGFPTPSHLVAHERVHSGERPFQCIVCKKAFTTNGALTTHVAGVHRGEKQKRAACRLECDVCGKRFSTPSQLVRHEWVHTGDRPYPCSACKRAFSESGSLRRHEQICALFQAATG